MENGDIVVTARWRSQRSQDVPATLALETEEDLAPAGVIGTQDLQRVIPGLVFTFTGSWKWPLGSRPRNRQIQGSVVTRPHVERA